MPFVLRTTETPPLNQQLALEQIILVDKTGPVIPLGISNGAACMVAEFLKGPFLPREMTSTGQIGATYGGVSTILSQKADGSQDGSGARFEGNGAVALLGKQFLRLVLERVNTDMLKTAATTRASVKFVVTVAAADKDPLDTTRTGKEIVIPAGTRFADAALATAIVVIALSQDVVIPKGTALTSSAITISSVATSSIFSASQDAQTGALTLLTDAAAGTPLVGVAGETGPSAFFVLGVTAASGVIDTIIDAAIPNTTSTITGTPSTVDNAGAAAGIDAPGTGTLLNNKIESLYEAAIIKTLPGDFPMSDINVIWAARRGKTAALIRTPLEQNAIDSSSTSRGRIAIVAGPRVGPSTTETGDTTTTAAAVTEVETVTPGESPGRSDRKIVTFPYVDVFSSDLGRNLTVSPDGFMASTLSQFPEEKNPGAANQFIQSIQSFQDAFANTPLARQDYINFKAKGVAALLRDRSVGWWFQSGVTSVDPAVEPTRAPIKRRRMADFIQDTIAGIAAPYNKQPATVERVDALTGVMEAFLTSLKSPQNQSQQRIEDFAIDAKSANTPQLTGLGIFTFIVKVRLLASMDVLVFSTSIGETVEIEQAA